MIKNMYIVFDNVGQLALAIDYSSDGPDQYIANQNRINLANPTPFARNVKYFHFGTLDDETMEAKLLPTPQPIGDLSWSVKRLDAEKAAREAAAGGQQHA